MITLQSRILGAQLGAAIGDALGAPLEFLPPRPKDKWMTEMEGGGVLKWEPGDTTDDTFMNLTIADMYAEKGKYNQKYLVNKWLHWKNVSKPKDMGNWTHKALTSWEGIDLSKELRAGDHPAVKLWSKRGKRDAGNGGVMRCIPSALALNNYDILMKDTMAICEDSHPDPRCLKSCIVVNSIVFNILETEFDKDNIKVDVKNMTHLIADAEFSKALNEAQDLPYERWTCSGYTIDTVRCALACLLQSDDFENALVALVNRGNDSDTVGAVAGGMLGAFYGVEAIPERWLEQLKDSDRIIKSAEDLYKLRVK